MEREERTVRQTIEGLESLVQEMRMHAVFGRTKSVTELYCAVVGAIEMASFYMESKSDKFDEASYDILGEDLDFIQRQAETIEGIEVKETA